MPNNNNVDDIPPPPYSETDIYSNPGDPLSPTTNAPHHRRGSSFSRQSSPPSTVDGEVIYTPPLTPRTGSGGSGGSVISNFNFTSGPNSNSNAFSNYAGPTGSVTGSVDHITTASAQAYFDSRPLPTTQARQSQIVHAITVREDSSPDDFPFPAVELGATSGKDITPQDWQTFVNYLLPNFHAVNNERVIDRKLRAEGLSSPSSPVGDNSSPLTGNRTTPAVEAEAQAQLDQIRSPVLGAAGIPDSRRQVVEQTVREWNEGFFGPRGVTIRVVHPNNEDALHVVNPNPMPGGWDASFDTSGNANANTAGASGASAGVGGNNNNSNNNNNGGGGRSRFARFMPQFGAPGGGPSSGPRGPFGLGIGAGVPGGSFRLGGIAVDGDRLSIGDRFVADRNGLRIGSFVADNNGISMNGQPMFGAGVGGGAGPGGTRGMCNTGAGANGYSGWGGFGGGGCHDGAGPWGRGWGGGRGRYGHGHGHHSHGWGGGRHGPWGQGPDHDHNHEQEQGQDEDHGRGFGRHRGRRGRGRERHNHHRSRSRSVSSVSSVSSTSSSSSESSIGSLPDHDELKDSQLPAAKEYLLAWLHDPEQPITKEKIKDFKQKVREVKNTSTSSINEPANVNHDQKAMRKEVKALMRDWKNLKRQQTKLRRQLRRERKQQRRAEKKEKREVKREMKRAAREQKRAMRNGAVPTTGCSSSSSVPQPGPGGFVPPVIPPIPPIPPVPFAGVGGPFNNGQNNGGFFSPFNFFGGGSRQQQYPPQQQTEGNTTANRGSGQSQAPGAWPSGDDTNNTSAAHGSSSKEKYKAADELEAQLIQKETELFKLHEEMALNTDVVEQHGVPSGLTNTEMGFRDASVKEQKQRLAARDLEEEIEDLAKRMALMRTEADAEYARELAGMEV